jgi:1-acyl-sn-glycerol-3-phosphate acyltransferase
MESESAHVILDGLVSLPDRRTRWRATAGISFWLGAPLLVMRLLGRAGRRHELHRVARWWARGVTRHLAIRLHVEGLDLIEPGQAYVVTPLHEGFADALALLHLPLDQRFAVRDELFSWRLFGGLLRDTEQLELCPELGMQAYLQLRRQAPAVLEGGESLVLFPQGSILGIEIDFKSGPFALAEALGRPILPVALSGSHRVWEHPYSPRLRYGQRISLAVLPPVDPNRLRALGAEGARVEVQHCLKTRALDGRMAPPRRFVPERDGYWDDYAYEIDPSFPALRAEIERHRAARAEGREERGGEAGEEIRRTGSSRPARPPGSPRWRRSPGRARDIPRSHRPRA